MIIISILILLFFFYSAFIEPYRLSIKTVSVNINGIYDRLDKIKIIHITDLHIKEFGYLERKVVDEVNKLMPDLLFITGDFIKNNTGIEPCAEFFKKVKPKYGIYGVLGNNDYEQFFLFSIDTNKLKMSLADSGVNLLFNENHAIDINGVNINILGVEDSIYGSPDISKAVNKIPNGHINILLSHSPSIIKYLNGFIPDLILTGHTHGGQVRLPFIEYLWTPLPVKSPREYSRGLFEVNKTKMYVNQGIGTSGLPVRFLCPPEISEIKLYNSSINE